MRFTDEELQQAAIRLQNRQLAQLSSEETYDYELSPTTKQQMQELIIKANHGEIKQASAHMGWQYYTRRGTAAILLCFLLACIMMPEIVMAGYQKIFDIVETVFEQYTDYRFTSYVAADTKFVKLTFQYLPDGLNERKKDRGKFDRHYNVFYMDSERKEFFDLKQTLITEDSSVIYAVDSEGAIIQIVSIQNDDVKFFIKNGEIIYMWIHGPYLITGQTNLPQEELINILQQVVFDESQDEIS